MKQIFAVLAVIIGFSLYSVSASAQQSDRSFEINASVGVTGTSIKDFPAFPRDFGGCVGADMYLMPKLSMGMNFCHLRGGSLSVDPGDGSKLTLGVSRNAFLQTTKFHPVDWHHIRPYGEFGMGYVTNKFSVNSASGGQGQNGYATALGGGFQIDVRKHYAFGADILVLWGGHVRSTVKAATFTYRF